MPERTFDFRYFKTQFGDYALYQPSTQSMYAVDEDFINYVKENTTVDLSIAAPINMESNIAKYFNEICNDVKEKMGESIEEKKKPENYYRQVVVNVSHDCNLRCKYCYASQGSYGREVGLMSIEVADQILKFFRNRNLGKVMFFGGEPLLNTDTILYLCEGFTAQQDTAPIFSLITNGTIVNNEILNLLKKYDVKVTVSLDGPQEIHDKLRPFDDGCGSYDLIKSNFVKLRECLGDENVSIETVFTKHHKEAGYDMSQLRNYIADDMKLKEKNMVLCHSCMGEDKTLSFELEDEIKHIIKLYDSFYEDVINKEQPIYDWEWIESITRLGKRKSFDSLCPLGEGVVCVTPNGDIYPCHNLAMINDLKIGNVFEDNLTKMIKKAKEKVGIVYKANSPQCQECWFMDICKGCPAKIYLVENSVATIPQWFCDTRVEFFIQKIGWLIKMIKENKWEKFESKLIKACNDR